MRTSLLKRAVLHSVVAGVAAIAVPCMVQQIPSAEGSPRATDQRLADLSLKCRCVTPETSRDRAVSGSIGGHWWTEPGSERALWYVVAGFRDGSGSWVGGDPVAVRGMSGTTLALYPGRSFSGSAFTGLKAPAIPGRYAVWVQMVPVVDLNGAIRSFKSHAARTEKQYHKMVGSVRVR